MGRRDHTTQTLDLAVTDHVPPPYAKILANTPAVVMVLDRELTITWVNDRVVDLFGFRPDEAVNRSVLEFIDPDWADPIAVESVVTALNAEGVRLPMLFRILRKDGTPMMAEVTANAQFHDPVLQAMVVLVRPFEERHLIDRALEAMAAARPLEETLELLVRIAESDTLSAATSIVFDLDSGRRRCIHSTSLTGLLAAEPVEGDDPWPALFTTDRPRVWDTAELPPALAATAEADGHRACWVWPANENGRCLSVVVAWRPEARRDRDQSRIVAMDRLARVAGLVVAKSRADDALAWAASHDPLTGLANRARFFSELTRSVSREGPGAVGVLAVDLDNFKPVNDRYGHAAGDAVLKVVADRLESAMGPGCLAARLGGDEFVAVAIVADDAELDRVAADLLRSLRRPVEGAADVPIPVSASIGVASRRPGACTADELVKAADDALYRAKAGGRGRVCRAPALTGDGRGAGFLRRRADRLRSRAAARP